MRSPRRLRAITLGCIVLGAPLAAQVQTEVPPPVPGAQPVSVERVKIHGAALEGNLEGDAVDRDAIVFLPPSYAKEKTRRYPVVYALHGYSIGAEQWTGEIHVPQTIEGALAQGAGEMIVVLPDSKTAHNGSMYSSSVTTGDFERFIAHDVVAYVDSPLPDDPRPREPRPGGPLHGRLRSGSHRHEASRRVRQPVHHEPVLPRPPRLRTRDRGPGKGGRGHEDARGRRGPAVLHSRPARHGRGLVAQPQEPPSLSRPADEGRRRAAGRSRQVGRECAARFRGSIRRQPPAVPRDLDRRGRPGRPARRCRSGCTRPSTRTASRTASRSTRARTRAGSRIASRTTC